MLTLAANPGHATLGTHQLGPLFGALKAVTADADAAVRTAAGKCFWALHAQRPNESGDFMAKLDPAQQKMLKRCQPK